MFLEVLPRLFHKDSTVFYRPSQSFIRLRSVEPSVYPLLVCHPSVITLRFPIGAKGKN